MLSHRNEMGRAQHGPDCGAHRHLRRYSSGVSYRPRPVTIAEVKPDARAFGGDGKRLVRTGNVGAHVPADATRAADTGPDAEADGRADGEIEAGGPQEDEEEGEEAEGRPAQSEEESQTGQGQEESVAPQAPLEHFDDDSRERLPDGEGHLVQALPRYVVEPRVGGRAVQRVQVY